MYIPLMRKHLAIFSEDMVQAILKGDKTIESRFSQKKIPPFGLIGTGDWVYIKPPGKDIVGRFKVKKVIFLEGIDRDDWHWIKSQVKATDEFFKAHKEARFGTLIFIDSVEQFITSPIKISKSDLRGWMVLE